MKSCLIFIKKKKKVIPATCTDFTFLVSISKKTSSVISKYHCLSNYILFGVTFLRISDWAYNGAN